MTILRRSLVALITLLSASIPAQAQILYSGGTYTQDFNTLNSATVGTVVNLGAPGPFPLTVSPLNGGSSLADWSLFARPGATNANALVASGTGSSNGGAVYSFGALNNSDRAIGTLLSGATFPTLGVVFTNNTGGTLTQFTVSYMGEQWRYGGTTSGADRLDFEYQVGGSSIASGTFDAANALDFSSLVSSGTTGTLNGNVIKTPITATVAGLNWLAGQTLVLRWVDFNVGGSDDGLAIDDFSFSANNTPPPPIPPTVIATAPADNAINVVPTTSITITFNAAVNVTGNWFTIDGSTSGSHTALVTGTGATRTLAPSPVFAEGETVTVNVIGAQVIDAATGTAPMAADYPFAFDVQSLAPLPIHTIQGSGTASAYAGQKVSVEGIVTATFQPNPGLSGFYVQAAEADYDVDPATSEGIFVFNTTFPVSVGQIVRVTGTVTEFGTAPKTQTELASVTSVVHLGTTPILPAPLNVSLPFATATSAEAYEGMRVTLPQTLTVTDTFDLGHFGEVFLSNGRLSNPTNIVPPGAPAIAQLAANLRNMVMLDDAISTTYPDPTPYLADSAGRGLTRRSGSTTTGVTGIFDEKFGTYIIEPTAAVTFVDANPRSDPPTVGGTLKVAIGNVLNYFNGNGSGDADPLAAGFLPRARQRGADNQAEFLRQRAKVIAGIIATAPDIMGLTEIENDRITNELTHSYGSTSAIWDLVAGLNEAAPAGTTYAFVNVGVADIVTDHIHCAFIYRTQTVAPVGLPAMLNSSAFNGIGRNPLAQTFQQLSNGEKLTVCINHFKSKGSDDDAIGADIDQGDGQGAYNARRKLQAAALATWLAGDPTGSGDPDFLIIGDLNAYAKEEPITILEAAGYINLTEAAEGVGGYSYAFGGAFGHLDHALANDHLFDQVVDAVTWHVNSDEPIFYDYNITASGYTKTAAQQAINVGTPYRYADHDPVLIGLNLQPDPAVDVTAQLQITKSTLLRNLVTKRHTTLFTIKNTGATPLSAPVTIILAGLSPNAVLFNPSGFTSVIAPLGSPYMNLNVGADNILSPGETVTRVVEFTNPTNAPVSYTIKAVAGPGGR